MRNVPVDPVELIKDDHREVENLFQQFDNTTGQDRSEVLNAIIRELTVHAEAEEKAVYPVMRDLPEGDEKVQEAQQEHAEVKAMLAELEGADPDDEETVEKVHALIANVRHHVDEEENDLLPLLKEELPPDAYTELAENLEAAKEGASA
jgi:hemerythrin superfamily protein